MYTVQIVAACNKINKIKSIETDNVHCDKTVQKKGREATVGN